MWNYSFVASCALTLAAILVFYFRRPRLPVRANRTFLFLLILQLLVMAFDVVSSLVDERFEQFPLAVVYAANTAFFVLYLARTYWFYVFALRVVSSRTKSSLVLEWALAIPFIVASLLSVSSAATGLVFSIEEGGYVSGPLYCMLYICAIFYIVVSLTLLAVNYKSLARNEIECVLACNVILIVGNVARFLFPRILIMDSFCTLAVMVIFLAFSNPDHFMTDRGTAFNKRGFRLALSEAVMSGDYYVLGIVVRNYQQERSMLGGTQMGKAMISISRWLGETSACGIPYYLGSGLFALIGDSRTDWEELRSKALERFDHPWNLEGGSVHLSVSFVSVSAESGLASADQVNDSFMLALDMAQQNTRALSKGKWDAASVEEVNEQVDTLRVLEESIERRTVEIFLQPIIDTKTRCAVAAEALARLRDANGNVIPPKRFVAVAERSGHINALGEAVLERACEFVASNKFEMLGLSWVNVNLSPIQCVQPDLAERYKSIVQKYDVPIQRIHLEITEQSIIDLSLMQHQVTALEEAGFELVLDDYGTGYSNLVRIGHYPFGNIKLDMELVWNYCKTQNEILPMIVQGFKSEGYTVTAEGIESDEMARALAGIGCNYLQGFLFSRPVPVDEFVHMYA